MSRFNPRPNNRDEGVCQYAHCGAEVPDGITIQLCAKHIRIAYAAHIIVEGLATTD